MKKYPGIEYSWRPQDYWTDDDVLGSILRNVKGAQRRQMITDYWNAGRVGELEDELLKDTLDPEVRENIGRIHPSFMGGEYLPDYLLTEVEIARIELESTTSDVISIRARRCRNGIQYRIVDEYQTDFKLHQQTSRRPLTLQQLIKFLEGSGHRKDGMIIGYNKGIASGRSRHDIRDFTRITSLSYPELEEHCEQVFDDWVNEKKIARTKSKVKKGTQPTTSSTTTNAPSSPQPSESNTGNSESWVDRFTQKLLADGWRLDEDV
jgi:hypothetical protein